MTTNPEQIEMWWEIRRPNSDAIYGFGTEGEAVEYARLLDDRADLDVDLHQVSDAEDQDDSAHEQDACLATEIAYIQDDIDERL